MNNSRRENVIALCNGNSEKISAREASNIWKFVHSSILVHAVILEVDYKFNKKELYVCKVGQASLLTII